MHDGVFAALADPTRRHIVEQLSVTGTVTATALASDLAISRQAVSKHLGVLTDAGLTTASRVGRETRYAPSFEALGAVQAWVSEVEQAWTQRLGRLAAAVEAGASDPPKA